jgi:membrane peptidoglycan carboxypeptidase
VDTDPRRRRAGLREGASGRRFTRRGRNGIWSGQEKRFGLSRRWRRVVLVIAATCGSFILLLAGLTVYAAMTLPSIDDIGKATGTIKILDRNGNVIAEVGHDATSRSSVTIDQIAPLMQDAILSAEDRNFYNEGAFDFKRIVKAVVDDIILRRPAEGASTITQQLVKQAFFGQQASKSPLRKIREALLANAIDGRYSKEQILDLYLNLTYFGENAYGIENAAERYYGKHAKDLTLAEAAMLAGLPQAPSATDPYKNPEGAYKRMHYVLGGLVAMGKVTQQDADAADPLVGGSSADPTQLAAQQQHQQAITTDLENGKPNTSVGLAPHFTQYIQDQLQQQLANDPSYLNGDLMVTTTLDLPTQERAQRIVHDGIAKIGRGANNGALLMIDANTGEIIAMVGSADFNNNAIAGQYNVVTAQRQVGSSFKPYVYETAFREGVVRPDTILQDTPEESRALGGVQDWDRRYMGDITATRALLASRNIPAEQTMERAGVNNVIDFAHSLGITSDLAPNASTAIGTSAIRMIDHASAYAAFANGGHKVTAHGILRVLDGNGNVIVDNTHIAGEGQVMTPVQAWNITKILRGYASYWGIPIKWDTAGKSGSTDNTVDAYYMSYTPDWVVATWAGHTDGSNPAQMPMDGVFGSTMAHYVSAPFINSLPRPHAFTPVSGSLTDCASPDQSVVDQSACPTPTPSPSPSPSETPSPSPSPTLPVESPSLCPTGIPTLTPQPSPSPSGCP